MTTEIILTGTGVPHPRPGVAGPGALVRCGELALQFDAGRSTVTRLMDVGTHPTHSARCSSPTSTATTSSAWPT